MASIVWLGIITLFGYWLQAAGNWFPDSWLKLSLARRSGCVGESHMVSLSFSSVDSVVCAFVEVFYCQLVWCKCVYEMPVAGT